MGADKNAEQHDQVPFKRAKFSCDSAQLSEHRANESPCRSPASDTVPSTSNATLEQPVSTSRRKFFCSICDCPYMTYLTQSETIMSMPLDAPGYEADDYDSQLMRWQNRQLAKSIVDNTMNLSLERIRRRQPNFMSKFPKCTHVPPASYTLENVSYVLNESEEDSSDSDNDSKIEDEGILMAIQSHGLQSDRQPKINLGHINVQSIEATNLAFESTIDTSIMVATNEEVSESSTSREYVEDMDITIKLDGAASDANDTDSSRTPSNSSMDSFRDGNGLNFVNSVLDTAVGMAIQSKGLVANFWER